MPDKYTFWENKLLDDLEKKFPDDDISIIYIYIGPWGKATKKKQSLLVNQKKINSSWSPPLDEIETEEVFKAVYDMCVREIKNAKRKEK